MPEGLSQPVAAYRQFDSMAASCSLSARSIGFVGIQKGKSYANQYLTLSKVVFGGYTELFNY